MTLKRRPLLEERPLDSTTTRSREHYITDHMMKSYFAACHTKRYMRHLKKLMMVCVELTNLVQSSEIDPKNLSIIGQR